MQLSRSSPAGFLEYVRRTPPWKRGERGAGRGNCHAASRGTFAKLLYRFGFRARAVEAVLGRFNRGFPVLQGGGGDAPPHMPVLTADAKKETMSAADKVRPGTMNPLHWFSCHVVHSTLPHQNQPEPSQEKVVASTTAVGAPVGPLDGAPASTPGAGTDPKALKTTTNKVRTVLVLPCCFMRYTRPVCLTRTARIRINRGRRVNRARAAPTRRARAGL